MSKLRFHISYANVVATIALVLVVGGGTAMGAGDLTSPEQGLSQEASASLSMELQDLTGQIGTQVENSNDAVLTRLSEVKQQLDLVEGRVAKIETEVIPYLEDLDRALISSPRSVSNRLGQEVIPTLNDKVLPRLYSLCEGQYQLERWIVYTAEISQKQHGGVPYAYRVGLEALGDPRYPHARTLSDGSKSHPWEYCWKLLPGLGGAGPTG